VVILEVPLGVLLAALVSLVALEDILLKDRLTVTDTLKGLLQAEASRSRDTILLHRKVNCLDFNFNIESPC